MYPCDNNLKEDTIPKWTTTIQSNEILFKLSLTSNISFEKAIIAVTKDWHVVFTID